MAQSFDEKIEELRKKSRTLIRQLEETSKRVNNEVCHSGSQTLLNNCPAKSKSYDYWRMRNDSRGVGGVLCPDYFHYEDRRTDKYFSKPATGKIVISSKKPTEPKLPRKPVKGCYCYFETEKLQSKKTTDEKSVPCSHCRSKFNIVEIDSYADVESPEILASALPPLSGETLRKVEKITYSPTSEFLRRVQKKLSSQKEKPMDNHFVYSTSSSSSRQGSTRMTRDSGRGESAAEINSRLGKKTCREVRSKSEVRSNYEIGSEVNERQSFTACTNTRGRNIDRRETISRASQRSSSVCINDRSAMRSAEKKSTRRNKDATKKPRALKKCIRSVDRQFGEQRRAEMAPTKHPPKPKRIIRTISAHSRCCANENVPSVRRETLRKANKSHARCDCGIKECPEGYCGTTWQLSRETKDPISVQIGDCHHKVRDLKNFRQENYFETHGSTHTLVTSSSSSGSLEQYELNDRLFPEPVRRIHRDDIVVTMPPCATKQRKRIHYFPRHIVNQEKSISNTNYKKKRRSQSCGLTGHAVDLGVLKIPREVSNSLALKYQKGVKMFNK